MTAQYQYEGPLETGVKKQIVFVDYITFHYYSRGKQSPFLFNTHQYLIMLISCGFICLSARMQ